MNKWMVIASLLLLSLGANAAEVVRVPPFELHSSFWMSLHQTLINDAAARTLRNLDMLAPDEKTAWVEAVNAYKTAGGGGGNMTFAQPMRHTTDALTQVADDAVELITDAPLADPLRKTATIYRAHWWTGDDRANRFFIAYASALLREGGLELIRAHETAYRTRWPNRIRVYVTPWAGPFGAYTLEGKAGGVITTMSSRDSGYQGLRALEMLMHEGSHQMIGTVNEAITNAAKKHNVPVPEGLWHAILFATSSHLTVRFLADRGTSNYIASADDLLTRVWPQYRQAIETHWLAYLRGQGKLEEAIDKVVAAIPQAPPASP